MSTSRQPRQPRHHSARNPASAAVEAVVEAARVDPEAYGRQLGEVTAALLARLVRQDRADARARGRGARAGRAERTEQAEPAVPADQADHDRRDALGRIAALAGCLERAAGQGLPEVCRPLWQGAIALIAQQDASRRWAVTARTALWDPDAPAAERDRDLRAHPVPEVRDAAHAALATWERG